VLKIDGRNLPIVPIRSDVRPQVGDLALPSVIRSALARLSRWASSAQPVATMSA
jgi:hypothetical protein